MFRPHKTIALLALAAFGLSACEKEDITFDHELIIPPTYSFENVDYSGQTARLNQLNEMVEYVETANDGAQLDRDVLQAMFENTGGNANGSFSFTADKQLKNKCFGPHVAIIEQYFDQVVEASKSPSAASNGTAGVMVSEDGNTKRLLDENGVELAELIEKEIMGAVFYYQATAVYMGDEKMDVDNEEVTEGKGTEMEHHWDEAYGYFGANNDFPQNTDDLEYWAKYCDRRDDLMGSNEAVSVAFRKGRAAIYYKDYESRDEAITEVRTAWEEVCAATAIYYLNGALDHMDDDLFRNHVISEAKAFVQDLMFNPDRRVTIEQVDDMVDLIGENYYEVSADDLRQLRDQLAEIYELEDIKTQL